jgi:hypothetical protein
MIFELVGGNEPGKGALTRQVQREATVQVFGQCTCRLLGAPEEDWELFVGCKHWQAGKTDP